MVIGIEVGIDVELAESRNNERILDWSIVNAYRKWDGRVLSRLPVGHRYFHCIGITRTGSSGFRVFHDNAVF